MAAAVARPDKTAGQRQVCLAGRFGHRGHEDKDQGCQGTVCQLAALPTALSTVQPLGGAPRPRGLPGRQEDCWQHGARRYHLASRPAPACSLVLTSN